MKKILMSLVAVLVIAGCNSDGGGGSTKNYDMELTSQNAQSMAAFADIGRSLSTEAVSTASSYRSAYPQSGDISARNTGCYTYSETGDSNSGSVTITYTDCGYSSGSDSISFDGSMTVSWSGDSYSLSGNLSMSGTSSGASFSVSLDPMEIDVVDNGSTLTTTIEMTIVYEASGEAGQFTISTIEPLTAPSGSPSYVNGKLSISDGTNTFTITYVDGSATVQ